MKEAAGLSLFASALSRNQQFLFFFPLLSLRVNIYRMSGSNHKRTAGDMYSFIQDFHIVLSYNKKINANIMVDHVMGYQKRLTAV